ncbi:DUF1893 domain-containing protein [Helicovermis profundi]|uniref:DUF1893 domain-containing protein n=1 Tax=Helicovermis profundi TaxID=3065157 RepID=A0AAU9E4U0_9FIRM|nr:DUF1893 domain-containing protein [Clostridia bacterium S502]
MNNSDLVLAKEILYKNNYKICVVKNDALIFFSEDRGILPMYKLVREMYPSLEGASIADRVVGRAAALLSVYAKVQNVYSEIISEGAIDILQKNSILVSYNKKVRNIKNRDRTDLCPVEKLSSRFYDYDYKNLINEIEKFLKSIKAI